VTRRRKSPAAPPACPAKLTLKTLEMLAQHALSDERGEPSLGFPSLVGDTVWVTRRDDDGDSITVASIKLAPDGTVVVKDETEEHRGTAAKIQARLTAAGCRMVDELGALAGAVARVRAAAAPGPPVPYAVVAREAGGRLVWRSLASRSAAEARVRELKRKGECGVDESTVCEVMPEPLLEVLDLMYPPEWSAEGREWTAELRDHVSYPLRRWNLTGFEGTAIGGTFGGGMGGEALAAIVQVYFPVPEPVWESPVNMLSEVDDILRRHGFVPRPRAPWQHAPVHLAPHEAAILTRITESSRPRAPWQDAPIKERSTPDEFELVQVDEDGRETRDPRRWTGRGAFGKACAAARQSAEADAFQVSQAAVHDSVPEDVELEVEENRGEGRNLMVYHAPVDGAPHYVVRATPRSRS
jgi:hypothetical protein